MATMLKLLDQIGGLIWNAGHDALMATKRAWDEAPRTTESETARMTRMRAAADAKFRYILENDLCQCPNCKEKRHATP